ncbi:MAG: hypothetical protein LWW86_03550 [Micrococcales bacterium]|nr:hypothetical protein [Micrococcales bacterium]
MQGGIEPRLLLASTTGAPLDIGQLSDLSYRTVQGGLGVAPLAQSWVGGGYSSAQRGQWVLAFGLAALGLVLIAGWATLGAEALSRARSLRVMTALYGTSGWAASYAFVNVALPLLVATASGVATYLLLPIGFSLTSNVMQPSLAYAAVSFAASLLAGVLTAAITARAVYQPIAPGAEVTSD